MSVVDPSVATADARSGAPFAGDRPRGITPTVLRTPRGACAAAFLLAVILACALAGVLAPAGPDIQQLTAVSQGPSVHHLLGTDQLGRDILTRLLSGGRSSLIGVAEAVGAMLLIAVPLGVFAGYNGRTADRVITRLADLAMSIPVIIILLAVLAIFGHSMTTAMIAFGVLGAAGITRVIRSAALAARDAAYIAAAEVMGLRTREVVFRHVLPQCRGVIVVQTALFAAIALGVQTGLTYLSLGPPPPAPTWGGMVADAVAAFYTAPWQLVPSGAAIALTVIAFGVLGDVVRDAIADTHSAGGRMRRSPRRERRERREHQGHRGRLRRAPAQPVRAGEPLLCVDGLSVAFGHGAARITPVENVALSVGAGEAIGIVGESGSGKTVAVKALAGLLAGSAEITGGAIRFAGADLLAGGSRAYRAIRGRGMALVTQEPMRALDPTYRVGTLLSDLVRAIDRCGRPAARARALELLARVQIADPEDVAERYPHEISGGMAQRIALALALVARPKLLLADEPTTALDVTVQAEILDLLADLQRADGMAIVLVSHDLGVVAQLCSRICVMYAGEIVETAPTAELFARPLHPYTRALLDCSPGARAEAAPPAGLPGSVPAPHERPPGCRFANRCPHAIDACSREPVALRAIGDQDRTARCLRVEEIVAPVELTR